MAWLPFQKGKRKEERNKETKKKEVKRQRKKCMLPRSNKSKISCFAFISKTWKTLLRDFQSTNQPQKNPL